MIGKVCGTGSCVPAEVWDNQRLAEMVETSDEWIRERTGVARRHIARGEETTVYLASKASMDALENAGMKPEEVELIIAATISPDQIMPSTACEIQKNIGAVNATCFDLNAACTGFLFALNTAQAYLSQGIYKTALIVGAETLSNLTNWKDRSTCILFGDGAGAAVLKAEETGIFAQVTHSDGEKGGVLTCTSRNRIDYENHAAAPETYMQMDGKEVFKFAVSKVPEAIDELLEKAQMDVQQIDHFLLHQANERIIRSVAKRLKQSIDKFPINMEEYGNTSSASIPILLDNLNRAGALEKGDKIIISGFGAGLSYGASLIEWQK